MWRPNGRHANGADWRAARGRPPDTRGGARPRAPTRASPSRLQFDDTPPSPPCVPWALARKDGRAHDHTTGPSWAGRRDVHHPALPAVPAPAGAADYLGARGDGQQPARQAGSVLCLLAAHPPPWAPRRRQRRAPTVPVYLVRPRGAPLFGRARGRCACLYLSCIPTTPRGHRTTRGTVPVSRAAAAPPHRGGRRMIYLQHAAPRRYAPIVFFAAWARGGRRRSLGEGGASRRSTTRLRRDRGHAQARSHVHSHL